MVVCLGVKAFVVVWVCEELYDYICWHQNWNNIKKRSETKL